MKKNLTPQDQDEIHNSNFVRILEAGPYAPDSTVKSYADIISPLRPTQQQTPRRRKERPVTPRTRFLTAFLNMSDSLAGKGFVEEVREYTESVRIAFLRGKGFSDTYLSVGETLMLSLIFWGLSEAEGEQGALRRIPVALSINCEFFLGEPWVRKKIAAWYRQRDEKKVHHAFFGTTKGKKGVRSLARTERQALLELVVFNRGQELTRQTGFNESMRIVSKELRSGELGIQTDITAEGVRRTYNKLKSAPDPHMRLGESFTKLFSP
jgi:hypothetical protein